MDTTSQAEMSFSLGIFRFLKTASELQQQLGIVVTTPQDFLDSQAELT